MQQRGALAGGMRAELIGPLQRSDARPPDVPMAVIFRSGGAQAHCPIGGIAFMARQKPGDEIEMLRKQREQLDARLKAAEARRKEKEQQQNERRKMIVGTIVLEFMAANPDSEVARTISGLLDKQIPRPTDRALFSALAAPAGKAENAEPKAEISQPE
jgi:hypothetical protein